MKRFICLLFLISLPFTTLLAAIPPSEREALIALYDSTNGDGWNNNDGWKGPSGTECTWYGVRCNDARDSVIELNLSGNNLFGSLPAELGNLVNLKILYLSFNKLSGPIPAELGNLLFLEKLFLYDNQLSGAIPAELGNLTSLQHLGLYNNQLNAIPAELGNLLSLKYLYLSNNQLSTIPVELSNLLSLEYLALYNNQLSGPIPAELGNLPSLQYLILFGNQLSGPVPATLMQLGKIHNIILNHNALFTSNSALDSFLDSKSNIDWSTTQTVAPLNVVAVTRNGSDVELTWSPIEYTGDMGGYHVYYGTQAGGPYPFTAEPTTDKTIDQITITGLDPKQPSYFFVVRTRTDPHGDQANTVWSGRSAQACWPPAASGDRDCDGIPDADEYDQCEETDYIGLPVGTSYSGPGNTRLSSGQGVAIETDGSVAVEPPHRLIVNTPAFVVPRGSTFRVASGALWAAYPQANPCASF